MMIVTHEADFGGIGQRILSVTCRSDVAGFGIGQSSHHWELPPASPATTQAGATPNSSICSGTSNIKRSCASADGGDSSLSWQWESSGSWGGGGDRTAPRGGAARRQQERVRSRRRARRSSDLRRNRHSVPVRHRPRRARARGPLRGLARIPGRALPRHVLRTDPRLHGVQLHLWRHRHVRLAEHDGPAAAERPQAAVFVFSGNAFTPCMDGVNVRSPQYYDLYTNYTEQAIGIFSAVGAHVFLVGTPVDESSVAGWDHLDDIYRQLAQANPLTVTFVDAGLPLRRRRAASPGRCPASASSRAVVPVGRTWSARPMASTSAQTEPRPPEASPDRVTSIRRALSALRLPW